MIRFKIEEKQFSCCPMVDIMAEIVPEMQEKIAMETEKHQFKVFVFDLSNVKNLDSIGVNLIVGVYKKMAALNRSFTIVNSNKSIVRVLTLFKLDRHFVIN